MALALGILGLGLWNAYKNGGSPSYDLEKMYHRDRAQQNAPSLLRDNTVELGMTGRQHNDVRGPFGQNPHAHEIVTFEQLNDRRYMKQYQSHEYDMRVRNQKWELDPNTQGAVNNYCMPHIPEPCLREIYSFQENRERRKTQWPAGKA